MYTYLSKDKGAVMLEVELAAAQGGQRGGPTAEGALAGLLGCGVHRLPASQCPGAGPGGTSSSRSKRGNSFKGGEREMS